MYKSVALMVAVMAVLASQCAAQEIQDQGKTEVAEQVPLDGRDLVAWKLARQAAEMKCKEWSTPRQIGVPAQAASGRATHAINFNAQQAAQTPTYTVVAEPQRRFMTKSDIGDWIFIIPVKASYYNVEKKARGEPVWKRMLVKVTDYGTEIRVEDVRFDSD